MDINQTTKSVGRAVKVFNLGLSFLLELCLLGAYGYWGFQTHEADGSRWLFGIGTPVIVAIIWAIFFAPKSQRRLKKPLRYMMEFIIFAVGVLALLMAGQVQLGLLFALAIGINMVLMIVWDQ